MQVRWLWPVPNPAEVFNHAGGRVIPSKAKAMAYVTKPNVARLEETIR